MQSWPAPYIPVLDPAYGAPVTLRLYDTADDGARQVELAPGATAGVYVCGITPYDSTHLGHAATYLAFDLINRQLLDNGHQVHYVQNITDVDDPLFERAERDGVDWRTLGHEQIELFRSDMTALKVIPPQDYIGAIAAIPEVIELISQLLERGAAYQLVADPYPDIYASISATAEFGYESRYDRATMEQLFAERGGDPDRPGKADPLDALLWRAHREGEPAWPSPFGPGRPGWHIECAAIASTRLGGNFLVQGGGADLRFPHHEYSAAHVEAAGLAERMAQFYVHTGMIGLAGTKMSKSLGNLVFVRDLIAAGTEPSAIRLAVFAGHYRSDRDWSTQLLAAASARLERWRSAASLSTDPHNHAAAAAVITQLRSRLAADLDTPAALAVIDQWAATGGAGATGVIAAVDALLGVDIQPAAAG